MAVTKTRRSMAVSTFNRLPPHPRQRNTEERAKRALKTHLAAPGVFHDKVVIAIFNGIYYKADGNTRSYLWERGLLEAPERLDVEIVNCETEEEFNQVYDQCDNSATAKTTADTHYGIMRSLDFIPSSPLLQKTKITVALWIGKHALAQPGTDPVEVKRFSDEAVIAEYIEEFRLLDGIGIKNANVWRAGVLGGALVALRLHGSKALPFLIAYNENSGEKSKSSCDGVEALRNLVTVQKATGDDGWSKATNVAGRMLTCIERYLGGKRFKTRSDGTVNIEPTEFAGLNYKRPARAASAVASSVDLHLPA